MPRNKKESLIFTVMMCFCMVLVMSIYNMFTRHGLSWASVKLAWPGLPLALAVAFVCDWFIVAKPAKKLAFKIVKPHSKPLYKAVTVSMLMVCGMVVLMSLFGAVCTFGLSNQAVGQWPRMILVNLIAALPLQLLIAGPLVRLVFRKLVLAEAV